VRVNVQLIKADTDGHLWAEIYDRKLDNIFSVQSEIAIAVAEALSAKVTGSEKKDLAVAPTKNAAAYDAYLRGVAFIRKGSYRDAARSLQEAVKLDPEFAVAWATLSRAESRTYHDGDRTVSRQNVSQQALNAALRLQPDLPEVLMAQAYYQYWVERDFAGARLRFEQVSAKWPNDAEATSALGYIARRQGRWVQSQGYMKRAAELDPLSFQVRLDVIENAYNMSDFQLARTSAEAALNIWPDSAMLVGIKAMIHQAVGELEQARVELTGIQFGAEETDAIDAVYFQGIYSRQYADAIAPLEALLAREKATGAEAIFVDGLYLYLGDLNRVAGDAAAATAYYNHVRDDVGSELKRQPGNALLMNLLALAYCGLGDRNAAMSYANRLVSLVPITKDAFDGVGWETTRARIWSRFGDRDNAIPAIAKLQKLPASQLTPAVLRMDPAFDKLRGDPRFEALLK
jgi:tetratricopeptide (TPR) repeat protein